MNITQKIDDVDVAVIAANAAGQYPREIELLAREVQMYRAEHVGGKTQFPPMEPHGAIIRAPERSMRIGPNAAYAKGWYACAEWAKRPDLQTDIGSPAYVKDRERYLQNGGAA